MEKIEFKKVYPDDTIPSEIKGLYMTSFPEAERRPWTDIEVRVAQADPVFNFFNLYHKDKLVGFITIWRLPGATYVEHFAIFPELRDKGYGSATIKELLDPTMRAKLQLVADSPVVLEVELPETSKEAERRIDFYRRCGMTDLNEFPYFQPPYQHGQPEVPMMLVTSGELKDPKAFAIILHTIVYNQ